MALRNQRNALQEQQGPDLASAMGHPPENQLSRAKPPPPPINTGLAARPAISIDKRAKSSWFSASTDLQAPGGTGKRPAGTRLTSDPAPASASEPQKGRKGLPFLKNPMSSLLLRRKTAQTVVETQPPPPSYDPRIKGTRVHDFSAPRPKRTVSRTDTVVAQHEPNSTTTGVADGSESTTASLGGSKGGSFREPGWDAPQDIKPSIGEDAGRLPESTLVPDSSMHSTTSNDGSGPSLYTSSSAASRSTQVAPPAPLASASVRTTASRQVSLSGMSRKDSVASAVPRHMKSTSSRFSFDMGGAAQQEKLLEERHRQRAQEKKTTDGPADNDARFDDFDEDFDYDAMMDDDGLEERIPGVNADYEYEEEEDFDADLDPDNDQENFAGFVFQRSNPASSLASPHTPAMLATPRDATGAAIGFAMTKDTTPTSDSPAFPLPLSLPKHDDIHDIDNEEMEIEDADDPQEAVSRPSCVPVTGDSQRPARPENDDIYFDDGLADELDFEHDGTYFDESIFDNHDTDQYGRPIPGAFAQAKEAMVAAQQKQQHAKHDSDLTSASGLSAAAQSTGDTSLSAGPHQQGGEDAFKQPPVEPVMDILGQDLNYQAALAAAAQMAAASGKFIRSSSPEEPGDIAEAEAEADLVETNDEPTAGYVEDYTDDFVTNNFDDYGTDTNFDDFDFDDEAIIAEANASALANDSDGFYGQEFGFYSAPIPHHQPHISSSSTSAPPTPSSTSNGLTSENLYHYSAGGYFGPPTSSLNRSTSGRIVCREPNLTPITERSEYSNRNSVLSFTLPPAIDASGGGGGGGAGARNSTNSNANSITSPGLAQLALLPEDDMEMGLSLEGLMRLRSKAWGGSERGSRGSSREGSPRSERAALTAEGAGGGFGSVPAHLQMHAHAFGAHGHGHVHGHGHGHVRVGSGLSMWSCSETDEVGGGSGTGSPVLGGVVSLQRPGSAGAVMMNGAAHSGGGVVAPLPVKPPSLASPLPGGVGAAQSLSVGGSACSPVLEGEEADAEGDGFALAPALPVKRMSGGSL